MPQVANRYRDSLLQKHREVILALMKEQGATNVRIFGSRMRGDAREDSDADFLVDFHGDLYELIGLHYALQDLLGIKVDVLTEGGLNRHIRDHILQEAILF